MSTAIKSITWNAGMQSVDVVFHYAPSIVYSYIGMTKAESVRFAKADSLGEYFQDEIKDCFPFVKTSSCCSARVETGTKCPVCGQR